MRRSKYLEKKFEHYQKMYEIRKEEHASLMERLKLEIILLEANVRKKLISELVDHFASGTIKQDTIAEIRETVLEEVRAKLKEDKENV